MSPVYLNPPPSSPIPFLEFKGDLSNFAYLDNSSHASSDHHHHHHDGNLAIQYSWHPQDKVDGMGQVLQSSSWPQSYMSDGSGSSYGHTSNHKDQDKIKIVTHNDQKQSKKWKPSKIRIMQKMMTTSKNMGDHKLQHDVKQQPYPSNTYRSSSNNNNNGIRVCVDCHTTTTPLWRSGPQGPKSLCNACGIRQRKARRAAMAAAELAKEGTESSPSPMSIESPKPPKVQYDQEGQESRGSNHSHPLPLKKRGKITFRSTADPVGTSNNCNGYNAKSQRVFPRDEEEGAILLMALSCGLACSS